jgi:hypothetical protein
MGPANRADTGRDPRAMSDDVPLPEVVEPPDVRVLKASSADPLVIEARGTAASVQDVVSQLVPFPGSVEPTIMHTTLFGADAHGGRGFARNQSADMRGCRSVTVRDDLPRRTDSRRISARHGLPPRARDLLAREFGLHAGAPRRGLLGQYRGGTLAGCRGGCSADRVEGSQSHCAVSAARRHA